MSQKANKNEPVGEDYGFCFCSREKGAILVIILLGLGLLVPGFMLRLEDADAPTPFLAVNICPSTVSGRYVVSATTCGAPISGDGSAQTIALKPVLLVNGVSYVPAIVRSTAIVDGSTISMSLVDKEGKKLFDLPTTSLKDHGRVDSNEYIDLANSHKAGEAIDVYRPSTIFPTQNLLCDDVRNGCKHVLASAQNKLIMKTVSFTVPAPDFAKDNLFAEFSAEMNLMISQADVRVPTGTAAAPEVYVVFQQLSLSALQYRGVVFIIGGTSTLVVALALQCFHWFFQRRKDLESHEALAHHD